MPLGMETDLSSGDFVLDGDPPLIPKRGQTAQFLPYVYCGQTAAFIKMPLGMEVGLSLCNIVLDGDPAPPPQRGTASPIFSPYLLWPNCCTDQDATWYGGRPPPRWLCVRSPGTQPPSQKGGVARGRSPQFSAHFYCGQTAGWIKMALGTEIGLGPVHIVL